jgi:putative acetyltransferase
MPCTRGYRARHPGSRTRTLASRVKVQVNGRLLRSRRFTAYRLEGDAGVAELVDARGFGPGPFGGGGSSPLARTHGEPVGRRGTGGTLHASRFDPPTEPVWQLEEARVVTGAESAGRERPPGTLLRIEVQADDPRAGDVRALLGTHLAFSRAVTPPAYSFALDVDQLSEPGVTFFSARADGILVGVGALKRLDDGHAELKSMHTLEVMRGRGVGRAMVEHILGFARSQGYGRISLETGTMDTFAPARTLYAGMGFVPCAPFADYVASPYNTWMTMVI